MFFARIFIEDTNSSNKLPRLFGKYYLLELINVGGMAEVFKAKMFGVEGFEKIVAIKRILPEVAEDAEFIKMFVDEAKIAVKLQHPNVVQIFELGKIEGSYFIAMELINGKDIKTIRKRLKRVDLLMPVEQSTYIISQVCEGLDYAHRKTDEKMNPLNIVHRDISPQNMIVSYEGTVKLIDFGIAKAKSKSTKTQVGMLKGKFSYMSPEQVSGQPIDRRSDIFSLGVVFFEMLTGKRLFLGKNDVETLEKIRKAEVMPPSYFNSAVPPELDRIVLKALAKDREERYQWASEFSEDLKKFSYSSGKTFSRQDMMNFMSEFFADELEEETAKLEEYQKIKKPADMPLRESSQPLHGSEDTDSDEDELRSNAKSSSKKLAIIFAAVLIAVGFAVALLFVLGGNKKDMASLIIDSNEKRTVVIIDENSMYQKRCETPCVIDGLLAGQHEIIFSKKDFIDVKESIFLSKGDKLEKYVKMYRIGEQKTMITVKSDPDNAQLYVNNKKVDAATPTIVNDIPVGMYIEIRVEKPGYFPYEENIGKVPANMNKEISVILKPMKDTPASQPPASKPKKHESSSSFVSTTEAGESAYLTIASMPWANIYINGKLLGSTPISKHELPAGNYKIQFKNPKAGIDKTIPVELKPGEHQRIIKKFD